MADREGDIRDLMDAAARRGHPTDGRVRAHPNRNIATGDKLWSVLAATEPLGELGFTLPAAPGHRARPGRQTLYGQRVTLPARPGAPALPVTALRAGEEAPPAGASAIEWRRLTNRVAETLEQTVEWIDWYRRRWLVAICFRILQSGCRVEALQLSTLDRRERALVIDLIIAWRILHVVTGGRDCPDLPCEVVFDPEEWPAAWLGAKRCRPPEAPPPLGDRVRLIAGFGGFLGRKGDGHPGPKALWTGLQRVQEFAIGIAAAKEVFILTD